MTAAQIQARVDAWLRARGPLWAGDGSGRRVALVGQWRHVCSVFGADSDAAMGVLLGLVREAWDEPGLSTREWGASRWSISSGKFEPPAFRWRWPSEVEALLSALEAAP